MSKDDPDLRSTLEDETALRWGFLEEEPDPCAVVSGRMELVYINSPGRALGLRDWFGKRCFEVFPGASGECAWECPTLRAVGEAGDIVYGEETLTREKRPDVHLGVAVIPLKSRREDPTKALLLLRPRGDISSDEAFQTKLLRDAESLRGRVGARLSTGRRSPEKPRGSTV